MADPGRVPVFLVPWTATLALALLPACDPAEPGDLPADHLERAGPPAPEPRDPGWESVSPPWTAENLREVAELQVDRDAEGLRDRLGADEALVRARAAFALASLEDHGAADELEGLLEDPRREVRRSAAFALRHTAPPGGSAVLLEALADEDDPGVRAQLLGALVTHGEAADADALLDLEPGSAAEEPGAREERHRTAALAQLGGRGEPGDRILDALVRRLDHEDPDVRRAAALFFALSGAAGAWEERGDRVREALARYDLDEPAAMYLLLGMGIHGGEAEDAEALVRWMEEAGDWRIRVSAANALSRAPHLSAPGTREALRQQIEEGPSHVAAAATRSYVGGVFRPPEVRQWMREWVEEGPSERWRTQGIVVERLAGEDPDLVLEWARRVGHEHPMVTRNALRLLEGRAGPDVRAFAREAADHEDPAVRAAAAEFLARRTMLQETDEEALEEVFQRLEEMLLDGSPEEVARAAGAVMLPSFGRVDGPTRVAAAAEARAERDPPPSVLAPLLHAVGEVAPEEAGLALAERYEDHPDARVRTAARWAAGLIRGEEDAGPAPPEAEPELDWDYLESLGPEPRLHLETDVGEVAIRMVPQEAPLTVQMVARLAEEGSYDGVPFHRVVPNAVTQGGDYARGDGGGMPAFRLRTELTRVPFQRGGAGMASRGRDTETSQFFVTHSWQPRYELDHTAFGWLVSGGAVVDAILPGDRIRRARVERGTGEAPSGSLP